jgi:predicted outer membrane repeat protein
MGTIGRVNTLVRAAVALLVIFAIVQVADAATITVNSLADPGASGICGLRDAITAANTGSSVNGCVAGSGNDTIVFSVTGTITTVNTLPAIANTLTIQGPVVSPPAITISSTGNFFNPWFVDSDATLNLSSVTISISNRLTNLGALSVTNSVFTGTGTGAISSEGSLTLKVSSSTFSFNECNACGSAAIQSEGPVAVTNSTFEHNESAGSGGAISADSLTVTNSTFTDNSATFGGGAISAGTLTVSNSSFGDNSSFCLPDTCLPGPTGGAIDAGLVTVSNSAFTDNSASFGGAIDVDSGTITNSTFTGNTSKVIFPLGSIRGFGGAILSQGSTAVTNSTFSANSADVDSGGGIFNNEGALTVTNSTFNGNAGGAIGNGSAFFASSLGTVDVKGAILTASTGGNCVGPITDDGYNLDDDGTCAFSSGTNPDSVIALDPTGLRDNGGPTQTIALEAGSVAINQIPVANCTDQSSPPVRLLTDQRGVLRPQFTACDIGAYEYDTARSLKTAALNAINSTTGVNRRDQQRLKLAAGSLYQAALLLSSGGNSVNRALGGAEFLAEETAVQFLIGIAPSSQLSESTLETWLFNITLADRTLAVVAIANAGGNAGASQLVATGDAQAAAGDYLDAVISYRKAWSLVTT